MFDKTQVKDHIKKILKNAKNIAVLGCSDNPSRISYKVAKYMESNGYNIYPVNPNHASSLGKDCYNTLFDLPDGIELDVVDIFRRSQFTEDMVDQILEWSEERGQKPVIWTQLGVSSESAKNKAEEAAFTYIENRCLMADHSRFL